MIGRIAGTLASKQPPQIVVDAHGVGYEIDVPMSTFYELPEAGQRVTLLTHLVVREDAHLLYGFLTPPERDAFRQLIRISGIGPRIALAVLSGLSVDDLAKAIAQQDAGPLTRVPGIGKKTADRLLLELKGRLGAPATGGPAVGTDAPAEIQNALLALGYNEREAQAALKQLPAGVDVSDGIRLALRALVRN